jgi:hypothetical protein
MVIKRVSPMSAAKIGGILGVFLGLLVGAMTSLWVMAAGAIMSSQASDFPEMHGRSGALFGLLFGAGSIVIFPIFYGVLSFIMGGIYAALYNMAAKWVGGIEIEAS